MTIKLFYAPGACSLAPHIALQETGAPFEPVKIALPQGEQKTPAYLAINPKGRVPALVTDRGTLTETPAILMFICQSFPLAGLAPAQDAAPREPGNSRPVLGHRCGFRRSAGSSWRSHTVAHKLPRSAYMKGSKAERCVEYCRLPFRPLRVQESTKLD